MLKALKYVLEVVRHIVFIITLIASAFGLIDMVRDTIEWRREEKQRKLAEK